MTKLKKKSVTNLKKNCDQSKKNVTKLKNCNQTQRKKNVTKLKKKIVTKLEKIVTKLKKKSSRESLTAALRVGRLSKR